MRQETDEAEDRRTPGTGLVSGAVMGVILLITTTFLAQFPETRMTEGERLSVRAPR